MKQVFYSFALVLAFLLMISPLVAPRLGPAGENWGWGWGLMGGAIFFWLLSQAWFIGS